MEIELKAKLIEEYLDEILPNAGCELNYTTDYSFLIAVMLSAQTTDKKVNNVTKILFDKYKSLDELANAKYEDIYNRYAHIEVNLTIKRKEENEIQDVQTNKIDAGVFEDLFGLEQRKILAISPRSGFYMDFNDKTKNKLYYTMFINIHFFIFFYNMLKYRKRRKII